jgi:hypothetical protein
MSYENGIISITTVGGVTYGVAISDVQRALGRGASDLGLLCSDQEWYLDHIDPVTLEPVYLLRRVFKIRPMAKFKPVRHSKLGILTVAERASTRYGFGTGLAPTLNLTQTYPQNDWEYKPPRGRADNEWFRLRDFEGYSRGACAPLAVMVGQLVDDGESQILVFGDGMSNAVREDGKRWVKEQSLSLAELLQSGESLYGYYIAFLLVDKTNQDHAKNLIVTNKTMSEFVGEEYGHYVFKIYAEGHGDNPAVPLLSSGRVGNTFEIVACLMAGGFPAVGDYAVYTSTTNPAVSTLIPYSLGFESGCDRVTAPLGTGVFSMNGLLITSVIVTCTDMITEVTFNNAVYRAFRVSVSAVIDTTGASAWSGDEKTVTGRMNISNSRTFPFGTSPSNGEDPINVGVSTKVASNTSGQTKTIFSADSDLYLWVMKNGNALVSTTVTAVVTLDYPMDIPVVSEPGSATIQ